MTLQEEYPTLGMFYCSTYNAWMSEQACLKRWQLVTEKETVSFTSPYNTYKTHYKKVFAAISDNACYFCDKRKTERKRKEKREDSYLGRLVFYEDKKDKTKGQVICQDLTYYYLLKIRQRAYQVTGDVNKRCCMFCKKWETPRELGGEDDDFRLVKNSARVKGEGRAMHISCRRRYNRERARERRKRVINA